MGQGLGVREGSTDTCQIANTTGGKDSNKAEKGLETAKRQAGIIM